MRATRLLVVYSADEDLRGRVAFALGLRQEWRPVQVGTVRAMKQQAKVSAAGKGGPGCVVLLRSTRELPAEREALAKLQGAMVGGVCVVELSETWTMARGMPDLLEAVKRAVCRQRGPKVTSAVKSVAMVGKPMWVTMPLERKILMEVGR